MDFETIQPNDEIRRCSRLQMQGVMGKLIFTVVAFILIGLPYFTVAVLDTIMEDYPYLLPMFEQDTFSELNIIFSIIAFVTSGAFAYGWVSFYLRRVRGQEFGTMNIFDGFFNGLKKFFSYFGLKFFSDLFVGLWTLLLIVPGIVKAYSYSMAFYIKYDNPEIDLFDAITKSKEMMKGHKLRLCLLDLSFAGWALLAAFFTFGLGFFVLIPYIGLAHANFYENLKRNQEKQIRLSQNFSSGTATLVCEEN